MRLAFTSRWVNQLRQRREMRPNKQTNTGEPGFFFFFFYMFFAYFCSFVSRKWKLVGLGVRRGSIWTCFTRISTVPLQQERSLRSCHFCPWWPASSYQAHLTMGPRHRHLYTVSGWEQRSQCLCTFRPLTKGWSWPSECPTWKRLSSWTLIPWYTV